MASYLTVVERHPHGYVAYPLGLHDVIAGEGGTCAEAAADVTAAIRFELDTFGETGLVESPVLEAFPTDAEVAA